MVGLLPVVCASLCAAAAPASAPVRLNNLVTQLAGAPLAQDAATVAFTHPRDGWVFVGLEGAVRETRLDGSADPLAWRTNPDTGAFEAMCYLRSGPHTLRFEAGVAAHATVRAVPELAYCYYPATPHIAAFGPYDWAFVERHVLPHVNTVVTHDDAPPAEFAQWVREGRAWISNAALPGLSDAAAPSADTVFEAWAQTAAASKPGYSGVIVDEFLRASAEHYAAWSEGLRRLSALPGFRDRKYYAWCGNLSRFDEGIGFARLVMELGHRFAWEVYLYEAPTEDAARRAIAHQLDEGMAQWKERLKGVEHHMVVCLGYLCAPPESLNLDPAVDYHVFLDMQFQSLAASPVFDGVYGVMEYSASYADEESLRWAHRLFRHYCIEGKTTRLTRDPYLLPHLVNADFADGLKGWTVEAASAGTVRADKMKGLSWLQGRYPETRSGDQACWMTRSAQKPNCVRQTIRQLEPGRMYSAKAISANLTQLDVAQPTTLRLEVEGGKVIAERGIRAVYGSCYSHEVGVYTREHPAYFTFHRVVFEATAGTANVCLSDWSSAQEPGGPAGGETAVNFVEVQPYR